MSGYRKQMLFGTFHPKHESFCGCLYQEMTISYHMVYGSTTAESQARNCTNYFSHAFFQPAGGKDGSDKYCFTI